jgi:hypothetical protein
LVGVGGGPLWVAAFGCERGSFGGPFGAQLGERLAE